MAKGAESTIYSTKDINSAIRSRIKKGKNTRIEGVSGQDSIAVGFSSDLKMDIKGEVGDFFGALNNGMNLEVTGNAGRFLGDTMFSGMIVLNGNAKDGIGTCMSGGRIVIKGNAGGSLGGLMSDGTIIVTGDAGENAGLFMSRGDIIIMGNAGKNTGNMMIGGSIYVGKDVQSTGKNTRIVKLTKRDKSKLIRYLTELKVEGEFKFKKIVAKNEIEVQSERGV